MTGTQALRQSPTKQEEEMNTILTGSTERVVKTVCSMCYCSCGVQAHVKDGQVVKIEGDPDHPWSKGALCPKGLSGIELLYHPGSSQLPDEACG